MANVQLAKPGTHGTAVLQIVRSNIVSSTMQLKLQACDINYTQVVEDTTGSSDTVADTFHTAEGSGLLGGSIALQGLLQSQKGPIQEGTSQSAYLGISNIFSTNDQYCRMRWSVALANGITARGSMIVEQCKIRWVRTAATVQVTIVGKLTDTDRNTTEFGGPWA